MQIRISTIYVFFILQTLLSICFYLPDKYVDGKELIWIVGISIPLTWAIQKLRDKLGAKR
jgi:hypothetical protein